ncbi:MAG TPA: hypothetical protein VMM13_18250, partial [Euzebya sp.]|nr:hypothetical protein [Euzebya sp.]
MLGSYALELGALTPMFYTVREREDIQNIMESATGGRLHFSYARVGGLKEDLPRGFLAASADMARRMKTCIAQYEDLLLGNEIFIARTRHVGMLPQAVALDYGVSGCALHATGIAEDARISAPYCAYDKVEVPVPVGTNGDSFDRFRVLIDRMKASVFIIEQVLDNLPAGPINMKLPKIVKAPEGEIYVRTENPLGQGAYYLVSDGQKTPWRMKMRTPSFSNIQAIPYLLEGQLMPDMIAILGSIFFVVGDIDR